ncbi:hypothetical protein [Streptomyces virginiae]|uniref:hypothetical protein n=1 Tax=Streptomyces virginiae TaxID=1961 RepID=UPI002DD9642B|nr:hypothetical protein [Streptomyces virginiae]WSC81175.1 hypothetical protein OHA56_35280 [Streptomyces virginiae]
MASLHYDILTDPAPLHVPVAGEERQGSVYIVVSNPTMDEVIWYSIEIRVPCGQADGDLTAHPKTITARVERNTATKQGEEPIVAWDDNTGVLTVTARPNTLFQEAGSMALVLDGFPVSSASGLVLLRVTERAANGARVQKNPVTLSLLKQLPKVPRNFRAKRTLVAGGQDVVLQWDGPDTLAYRIQGPDGAQETVAPRQGAAGWQWSPTAGQEPKRDATYTLIATSPGGQQPGYFLTTTVHLRSPEFESVTATTGVHSPWVEGTTDKGRILFTARGAQIRDAAADLGTLSAARTDVETVTADLVRGRESDAGSIRFPSDGISVGRGGGNDLGTVTADKISVHGINTEWVGDRDSGKGWVEFPQSGVNVRKDGKQDWGTVAADGWIEFPASGMNVFQGAGSRQWGTVAAGKADLNDLATHRAQVKERLTLQGGLSVDNVLETQDGPPRLIVHGRLDAEGEVKADGTVTVTGDLTTLGMLRVQGESRLQGKVNAGAHLSVRDGDAWIMHTNDGKVAINGDLRVHGAFRSDS